MIYNLYNKYECKNYKAWSNRPLVRFVTYAAGLRCNDEVRTMWKRMTPLGL